MRLSSDTKGIFFRILSTSLTFAIICHSDCVTFYSIHPFSQPTSQRRNENQNTTKGKARQCHGQIRSRSTLTHIFPRLLYWRKGMINSFHLSRKQLCHHLIREYLHKASLECHWECNPFCLRNSIWFSVFDVLEWNLTESVKKIKGKRIWSNLN